MMPIPCVLFEDTFVDRLRPANWSRPTGAITVGAYSLWNLLREFGWPIHHLVRPHLRDLLARDGATLLEGQPGPLLFLNAALVPKPDILDQFAALIAKQQPFVALNGQRVTAAYCPRDLPAEVARRSGGELVGYLLEQRLSILDEEFPLLEYPFDIIRYHEQILPGHLGRLIAKGNYHPLQEHVYIGREVSVASQVAFDTSDGPIVIGDNVKLRPFSYVAGPVKIGDRAIINDHAAVKHATVIGHTVKLGGETEVTIIEPCSNKQHHGFLGHAYVGSWVNLGAGTSNSDLKNTYGEVGVEIDNQPVGTGMQFFGCVIGDYTKSAINTSIFTGKMIGIASFLYGFVTTNVPSFTNYARTFGQVTEVGVEVAIKTQARAAARRKLQMTDVDHRLFLDLFDLTRSERQLSSDQVSL